MGLRTAEKKDGHPVCVEPEDEEWDPTIFFDCAARAEEIYKTHPDHKILYGDAPSTKDQPENVRKKSVLEAVREVTLAYDSQRSTLSYCGWPTRVEGYYVVSILQFDKRQILEYPQLPAPIQFEEWTSLSGLLESAIKCLLEEATRALGEKDPGRFLGRFSQDTTAILRDAGKQFCSAISLATEDIMLQEVFDNLNIISSLPYEGAETIGELLFAPLNSKAIDISVHLNEPVPLYDCKLARKIIEMSERDLSCVCQDAKGIRGFGALLAADTDNIFRVTFSGHYKWDLYYKNQLIMKSAFGVPSLPSVRLSKEEFSSNIRRIFAGIDAEVQQRLWLIVEAAMAQKHGTMIVISDTAAEEAKRLKKQSLGIQSIELSPSLVSRFSGIDGAILISPKGICYAIGVILDGRATDEGDSSRGARYNSAVRYVAGAKANTICLVVSEDGYVNIVPKLRPQIRKSEIETRIRLLKTQDINNYNKTRNWLDDHRFYLTPEQCNDVNKELARIQSAPHTDTTIRIVVSKFEPHPAMNDSYYLPEAEF